MKQTFFLLSIISILLFSSCSDDDKRYDFKIPQLTIDNSIQFSVTIDQRMNVEIYGRGAQYAVDWGDGIINKYADPDVGPSVHRYKKSGKYHIKVWSENLTFLNGVGLLTPFSDLSIGNCPLLIDLVLNTFSDVKELNIENCPKLVNLTIGNFNSLTSLDISECKNITSFSCYTNPKLSSLDLSHNKELKILQLNNLGLTNIDLSANTKLTSLDCFNLFTPTLSLNKNTKLRILTCSQCKLENIEFDKLDDLYEFNCMGNGLTSFDFNKLISLNKLNCSRNNFSKLDFSKNANLSKLDCSATMLTELILENNNFLEYLSCSTNLLSKEELDAIFTKLPVSPVKFKAKSRDVGPDPLPYAIKFSFNPGTASCDKSIIENKGWIIKE